MSDIKQFDDLVIVAPIIGRIMFLLLSVTQARELIVPVPLEVSLLGFSPKLTQDRLGPVARKEV
jgi:hypothetical protein